MVANWLKILLFVAGGSTAAVATAYYTGIYDPWAAEDSATPIAASEPARPESVAPDAETESRDEPETAGDETAGTDNASATDAADAGESASEIATVTEPETGEGRDDDLVVPSFDIVRVEPDGSMVIAGSAEPNSQIEVVAGADVIARADVGAAGDFAAVLDDALRPGDYQIVLRSTGPGEGLVTTSQETAIVSVPEDRNGDVLALVEEPGAPSRLITVPETQAEGAVEPEADSAEVAAVDETQDASTASGEPSQEESAEGAATSGGEDEVPSQPSDSVADEEPAVGEAELAARSQLETAPTQDRPASPRSALAVEAMEIEGGTVFVAGRGAAGSTVRVYANEILLGEARVSDGGRFLIETQTELPVGDYIVRADVIGPGGEVTARAAVPFQREPGEAVAAVAPAETTPPSEPEPAAREAAASEDVAAAASGSQSEAASQGAVVSGGPAATGEDPNLETPSMAGTPAASPALAASEADTDVAAATPAIEETMAAPLEAADGAVIIRRGDTLWRISRRVYGRGVRYSTIYLANQEQIRDPDMIWPGQVFSVPDETEQGEKADMSTVSDQVVPPKATQ
ncbi:LysM peptidoglycan-binding domain-containing protein [Aliihoeflea sp. 40Bstr573]|uniref:LysM peptidoglycan-binding domain-containing protein n=1 Tax=Aliihoeflea sp. 40Bstr573 TaxID=2696467 RepID=UPI00209538F1|nr:LysM peptidoglycan-binding domain-containing protein [Aliihoeflea sp. 40Bstr573]MCO6387822.1 LysM peptidoglycan-binding domain-containing protein [Aliihoeflea sp. 40Bstr573]